MALQQLPHIMALPVDYNRDLAGVVRRPASLRQLVESLADVVHDRRRFDSENATRKRSQGYCGYQDEMETGPIRIPPHAGHLIL